MHSSHELCTYFCDVTADGAPYKYMALSKTTCSCGNSVDQAGSWVPQSSCDIPCALDATQMCGGGGVKSIYKVIEGPTSAPPTPAPPTTVPTAAPTASPTAVPTAVPTSLSPTAMPTKIPTAQPTAGPTVGPTIEPSPVPTGVPSEEPVVVTMRPVLSPESVEPSMETVAPVEVSVVPRRGTETHPTVEVGSIVAAVGGVAGGLSGGAMRLSLLATPCQAQVSVLMNPTGLVIGGSSQAGASVANLVIVVCVALLSICVLHVTSSCVKTKDVQALLRMPSLPFSLFHLLYQGLALSGAGLLLQPAAPWHAVLGATVLLVCVAVPAVVARFVARGVPAKAVYATAEGRQNTALVVMIGSGEWVNTGRDCMWVQRFDSVVRAYRQPCTWYILIEFSGSFAMGVVKSVGATTAVGCGHISMAMAAVLLILFVTKAVVWPHARQRDNVVDVICLGVQMAAMVHSSAGYYRDHGAHAFWTFGVASHLLLASTWVLLLNVALTVGTELYVCYFGYRDALQEDIYRQYEDLAATRELSAMGTTEEEDDEDAENASAGVSSVAVSMYTDQSNHVFTSPFSRHSSHHESDSLSRMLTSEQLYTHLLGSGLSSGLLLQAQLSAQNL